MVAVTATRYRSGVTTPTTPDTGDGIETAAVGSGAADITGTDEHAIGIIGTHAHKSRSRRILGVALRIGISLAAMVLAFVALSSIFSSLNWSQVLSTIGSLDDADRIALLIGAGLFIATQGLVTASTLPGLPVRRGVIAYLGPAAVSSVIPGPSDLPVRYRMYQSWGYTTSEAGLSISASGIFSIGAKLVAPALAGVVVLITGISVTDGVDTTLVLAGVVLVVLVVVSTVLLGSSRLTSWLAYWLQAPWELIARLTSRQSGDLGPTLHRVRASAVELLASRWPIATWAQLLFMVSQIGLMVMALRFMGVPQETIGTTEVFIAFGVVSGLTVLPITAGNVGVSEAGWIGVLGALAGSQYINQVTAAVLVYRWLTWLIIIPLGGLTLAGWRIGERRANRTTPTAAST